MALPAPAYALTLQEAQENQGKIGAGEDHSIALRFDGTVVAWGGDSFGQASVPAGLADVVSIAAGGQHSLALRRNGTVVAWGDTGFGESAVPAGLADVVSIAAGGHHSLALKSDGTVVAWGGNAFAQSNVPAGLADVVSIAAGGQHSLALRRNGTVVAWGDNHSGQSSVPAGLVGVVSVAAGGHHSLALKSDGTVVAWGRNNEQQSSVPPGLSGVVAVAAGFRHSLALKSDGTVVAWGWRPGLPPGAAVAISAGLGHSLALKPDGTVAGWGDNSAGQSFGVVAVDPPFNPIDLMPGVEFTITFSAPATAAANYNQITLRDRDGRSVAFIKSLIGNALTVRPTIVLTSDNRYTLSIPAGSVRDAYGTGNNRTDHTFFTPDTKPPVVVSVTPANGATGVLPGGAVVVSFGELVRADVNFSNIVLTDASGKPVERTLTIISNLLFVDPKDPLKFNARYTVTVPVGSVEDTSDNSFATTFTSSFTTTNIIQVEGPTRFDTAVAASVEAYPRGLDPAGRRTVVIATGRNWPDALGGTALAGVLDGPMLLVEPGSVPAVVMAEIRRLNADKAIILGGIGAVSAGVESALRTELGQADVSRIGGANRYATANAVAAEVRRLLGPKYDGFAFVATGGNFPDALAASPLAAANKWPLYLADPTTGLSAATKNAMAGVRDVVILGGPGAVSQATQTDLNTRFGRDRVVRLGGTNRFETAVAISRWAVANEGHTWNRVGITTGHNFPDALAGGVLQGKVRSVMLLTPSDSLNPATRDALLANRAAIDAVTFFGGTGAVSTPVRTGVLKAIE